MMPIPLSENIAFKLIIQLTSIQIFIASAEAIHLKEMYKPGGWLSWEFKTKHKASLKENSLRNSFLSLLFSYPNIIATLIFRILLAIGLTLCLWRHFNSNYTYYFFLYPLAITGILVNWANMYSNNGSDQIANIVLISV